MSYKYLDLDGVKQLWTAIKSEDAASRAAAQNLVNDLSLEYDKVGKTLTLKGSNNENVTISVEDFVKDGILESVEVITSSVTNVINGINDGTKFIKFTWNTDSGKTTDYLNVSDFAQTYVGSDSINISDSNTIEVIKVNADKTKVTESIPVAGGPLAKFLNEVGIDSIDANTDMQSLLYSLFCKVDWPKSTTQQAGVMQCSLNEPSFTLSNSGTTVEVGTVCTLSEVKITSAASPSVQTYPTVSGFTYGYSSADDNTQDSTDTSIIGSLAEGSTPSLTSDNYTMKVDYSNFVYAADSTIGTAGAAVSDVTVTPDSDYTNVKFVGDKLAVINGTNSVKVDITGPKAIASFASIAPHYACSNTKKTRSGIEVGDGVYHVSDELVAAADVKSTTPTQSKTLSVTGAYKYFIGCYSDNVFDNKVYTSQSIRTDDVKKTGFVNGTSINYEITVPAGTKGMYIAIPAGIDDSGATLDVKQKTNSNNPVNAEMINNLRTVSNMACAGTATKDYKVFTWSFPGGTAGEEIFTISKF